MEEKFKTAALVAGRRRQLTVLRTVAVRGAVRTAVLTVSAFGALRLWTVITAGIIVSARALSGGALRLIVGIVLVGRHFAIALLQFVRFHLCKELLVNFVHLLFLIGVQHRAEEAYVRDALVKALLIERDEFRAHSLQIRF